MPRLKLSHVALALSVKLIGMSSVAAQAPAPSAVDAVVRGVVVGGTGPIAGASVSLAGGGAPAQTDSSGHFSIAATKGAHFLHVRTLGYAPFDSLLNVSEGITDLQVRLSRSAVTLEERMVVASADAKPLRYANTTRLDEFYERRAASTGGTFLTREDIERSHQTEAVNLLRGIAGVEVINRTGALPLVRFARCSATKNNPFAPIGKADLTGPDGIEKEGALLLFINGLRVSEPLTTLAEMRADDVEAMEVYRGVAQLPMSARGDGCAAIYIWTRYSPGSVLKPSDH